MSRLDDLIQELCPCGIETISICDIADYEQPTKYIVESTDYNDAFETPVLTAGQTFILGYTNETNGIYEASKDYPVIIFDDFTGAFKWVDFPFKIKSSAIKIITAKDNVSIRYLYHLMGFLNYTSTEHKRLWISIYSKFEVALPPMEVQQEIVRLLDDFTAKTAELQAELNKEYEARKKQYEYYRDNLLLHNSHSKEVKLGEVATIGDGLHSTPKYDDNGSYYFINGNNIKNGALYLTSNTKRCSESEYSKHKKYIPKSTVMMSINGTIGSVGIYNNEPIILGKSIAYFITTEQLSDKFLYHYLQTSKSSTYFRNHVTGSTIKNLGLKALRDFQIYLPPIIDQKSIIRKLDEYESMSEGLQSKISSEIESRQKQYEFYRDKLLTFKELK